MHSPRRATLSIDMQYLSGFAFVFIFLVIIAAVAFPLTLWLCRRRHPILAAWVPLLVFNAGVVCFSGNPLLFLVALTVQALPVLLFVGLIIANRWLGLAAIGLHAAAFLYSLRFALLPFDPNMAVLLLLALMLPCGPAAMALGNKWLLGQEPCLFPWHREQK